MPTVLITGANRGIGLGLVSGYAARSDSVVLAVTRDAASSSDLHALVNSGSGNVRMLQADLAVEAAIENLAWQLGDVTIDLLINNAGTGGPHDFGSITAGEMLDTFNVNAIAPLLLTQALRERLRRGGKVVNISSVLGSIGKSRDVAGALSYGMSKAALNMLSVKLAKIMRPLEVTVVAMHPGGVKTRMGGPSAPMSVDTAAPGILRVIDALGMPQSGTFLDWDGSVIEW